MKRLKKKNVRMTVEAYACACSCGSACACQCWCPTINHGIANGTPDSSGRYSFAGVTAQSLPSYPG